MIAFNHHDPFPLGAHTAHSYAEAQAHSALVDAWIGLQVERIEAALAQQTKNPHEQKWLGLPSSALLTPYTEIRHLLHELNPAPASTIVDLGAGYGRMGFVVGRHYPEVKFLGYECVPERVREGQRCLLPYPNAQLQEADLAHTNFSPIAANFYFIYDYGTRAHVNKSLRDLAAIARQQNISVVGRGRLARDCIEREHPWLSVHPPEHRRHYSIYRSH
ncbi:MAG: SAM-dependent methyltransferase [Bdellovibrionales bacterium]|nr:SAM-dependent methyltransferase [Bdellovibrionales bacterium]